MLHKATTNEGTGYLDIQRPFEPRFHAEPKKDIPVLKPSGYRPLQERVWLPDGKCQPTEGKQSCCTIDQLRSI
jgi:hypothetical protein